MNENYNDLVRSLLIPDDNSFSALFHLLEYSPMAVYILQEDGVCIFENLAMREMLGDKDGKAVGMNIYELPNVKGSVLYEKYQECLQGKPVRLHNFNYVSSITGKELVVDLTMFLVTKNNVKAIVTIYFDTLGHVTGFLQNKIKSLEEERDLSYTLLNNTPIAILAVSPTGEILSANNAVSDLLENKKVSLIGKNIFETKVIASEKFGEMLERAIKGTSFSGELPVISSDGEGELIYHFNINPVINEDNVLEYIAIMCSDVTERVHIRKAQQDDLALASKIQKSIISDAYKNEIDELELFVHYQPMGEVGGDFYDISKLMPSRKIRIFITDATGHGVQGALTTMLIKGEYEKVRIFDLPPNKVLDIVNNNFVALYPNLRIYFTCFIIDVDLVEMQIEYSAAGHPEQFLLRDGEIFSLHCKGRYLGIFEKSEYQLKSMDIQKGDKLFLFTDGLYEEFSDTDEIFGHENLVDVIRKHKQENIVEHGHSVIMDVFGFKGWSNINDDITFIAAEIL